MHSFGMTAASWLLHTVVGGGLILLLVEALSRRTRQPARRQRLGEMGVAAALLVALLSLGPPWLHVPVEVDSPSTPAASAPAAPPVAAPTPELFQREAAEAEVPPDPEALPPAEATGPARRPPAVPVLGKEPAATWFSLETLAVLIVAGFGFGSALVLGRWLLGHLALWRLLRAAGPAPEAVARLFAAMTGAARRRPRLLVSGRLRAPISCGLLRPTVVLPAALCAAADVRKLRWVFAHELTHLARRDAWSCWLFGLGQAVYFYLPWFWALRRRVRLCQEFIADAAVTEAEAGAADYAEFLLKLTRVPALPVGASGVLGHSSDLYRRVSMLLQEPHRPDRRCSRRWCLAASGSLLTLAVIASGIGLSADPVRATIADGEPVRKVRVLRAGEQEGGVRVIVLPAEADGKVQKPVEKQERRIRIQLVPVQDQKERRIRVQLVPVQDQKAAGKQIRVVVLNEEKDKGAAQKAADGKKVRRVIVIRNLNELKDLAERLKKIAPDVDVSAIQKEIERALARFPKMVGEKAGRRVIVLQDLQDLKGLTEKLKKMAPQVDQAEIQKHVKRLLGQVPKVDQAEIRKQAVRALAEMPMVDAALIRKKVALALAQVQEQLRKEDLKGLDTEALKKALEKALRELKVQELRIDKLRKSLDVRRPQLYLNVPRARRLGIALEAPHLGVRVAPPSATLADQLDLPRGEGLVIEDVVADSAAAKLGLKVNDVLLELCGQKVPSDAAALARMVQQLKSGTPLTLTVLRKGKKTAFKGAPLAEKKAVRARNLAVPLYGGQGQPRLVVPNVRARGLNVLRNNEVLTTVMRTGDRFTTRYQEGTLVITLTGTVADGQVKVASIHIQDGGVAHKYPSLEKVPEQYRDKVKHLADVSGKPNVTIEPKKP
jgi:hypothetical protein